MSPEMGGKAAPCSRSSDREGTVAKLSRRSRDLYHLRWFRSV